MTGGYDQAVRVWDMRSRSYDAVQIIKLFADSVTTVAVSARCPNCALLSARALAICHQRPRTDWQQGLSKKRVHGPR